MDANRRSSIAGIILSVLLAGCAASSSPPASPTTTESPVLGSGSPGLPVASPATAMPNDSSSVVASPAQPSPTPGVSSPPAGDDANGFVTSAPPDAATAWTGITWQRLAPSDPLGHVRSITRWRGGYLATGDLAVADGSAHTKVWSSTDGRTWESLDADIFGPTTIVVGTAATTDGLVALTLQAGPAICDSEPGLDLTVPDCWSKTGPLQVWTSSDGTTWSAHPGPDIALPEMAGQGEDPPTLIAADGGRLLAVTLRGQPLATSNDGIAWAAVPTGAFPKGWRAEAAVGTAAGMVAVGDTAAKTVAVWSPDGRVWTSHALGTTSTGNNVVVPGATGLMATGLEYHDNGAGTWTWWWSLDGRFWRAQAGYPPLGAMSGSAAQECQDACPDGSLVGDGERMIAYRGWGKQAGWTSFDGRAWTPLVLTGRPEQSSGWLDDHCTQSLLVVAIGLSCAASDGTTWFGTPRT